MGFIADIFTGNKAVKAQKDASRDQIAASERATTQTLALQKEMFERVWQGTAVQREAGDAATKLMAQIMGLSLPSQTPAQQQPQTLPAQGNAFAGVTGTGGAANPLTSGPFGRNVAANGLAAVARSNSGNAFEATPTLGAGPASLNGGKGGSGPMFIRANDLAEPTVFGETGQTFGGLQGGNGSGVTAQQPGDLGPQINPGLPGQGGQPAGQPGATQPGAAFDVTAWLRSTPAYQSNLDAGQRQLNHGLASGGQLFSGEAGREAMRYGSDYNDRIFGDQFNRLAAIAGAGQTATSQGAASGANYANQGSAAYQSNANRLGSSYQNRGDAISGFWGDLNASWKNTENAFGKLVMGGF